MQKGWTTRTLLVLLCMVLLCKVPAYAMETRASDRINLTSVVLSKKSDGNLSTYFSVQATGRMDVIVQIGLKSSAILLQAGLRNTCLHPIMPQQFNRQINFSTARH